jgi:HK97 gp10 family phage protein
MARVVIVYNHQPRCAAEALARQDELCTNVAKDMHRGAQAAAPVRTGALRRGINVHEGNPAEVTASSLEGGGLREYAAYNEFGTRYMSANPFMMPGYVAGLALLGVRGREYGAWIEAVA